VFDEPTYGEVEPGLLIWRERAVVLHRGFLAGIARRVLAAVGRQDALG